MQIDYLVGDDANDGLEQVQYYGYAINTAYLVLITTNLHGENHHIHIYDCRQS